MGPSVWDEDIYSKFKTIFEKLKPNKYIEEDPISA